MKNTDTKQALDRVWKGSTSTGKSVEVVKLDKASFGYKWMVDSETGYPAQHFKSKKTAIEFALNMVTIWDKHHA